MDVFEIRPGQRVLFVGDSITDTEYRTRAEPLGYGYVMLFDAWTSAARPDLHLEVVNRGNDGDTVVDLEARWEGDVLAQRPDWLFVMIGVNDVINRYQEAYLPRAVTDEEYRAAYRRVLQRTREQLPSEVVLLEPTPLDVPREHPANVDLERLCGIVAEVAAAFGARVVPVQRRLVDAMQRAPQKRWYQDPTHPWFPGHACIAQAVLEHLGWRIG